MYTTQLIPENWSRNRESERGKIDYASLVLYAVLLQRSKEKSAWSFVEDSTLFLLLVLVLGGNEVSWTVSIFLSSASRINKYMELW